MLSETDTVVYRLAEAFNALEIPYMIGGSVASSLYGIPRLTQDVDIAVSLTATTDIDAFVHSLEAEFYVDGDMIRDAFENHSCFNVIYLATMIKADIFVPQPTEWRRQEWLRRRQRKIGLDENAPLVFIASPEDMVLQKLLWYRETRERSDRQWGDVQGMLKVQGDALDLPYMRHWADELKIADLLTQSLTDAGFDQ